MLGRISPAISRQARLATSTARFKSSSSPINNTNNATSNLNTVKNEIGKRQKVNEWLKTVLTRETAVIWTVFAITGSSTGMLVRPILSNLFHFSEEETGWISGSWQWRLSYLILTMPLYSTLLMTTATVFGRQRYFGMVIWRMYNRLLPHSMRRYIINKYQIPVKH